MTVQEYDAGNSKWVSAKDGRYRFIWTGWKRRYDPRLMTTDDPTVSKEPLDDSVAGQWLSGCFESKDAVKGTPYFYASVPGGQSFLSKDMPEGSTSPREGQVFLTIHMPHEELEKWREDGLRRLLEFMNQYEGVSV